MRLELRFENGHVSGEGSDGNGEFTITGKYMADGLMDMLKLYRPIDTVVRGACPAIRYQGTWNGIYVVGLWEDLTSTSNNGEIELWPLDAESTLAEWMETGELAASR